MPFLAVCLVKMAQLWIRLINPEHVACALDSECKLCLTENYYFFSIEL